MKAPSNPLALAGLALVFERTMHPYEMAATLKHRRKHESIKLRYGTLYTVIELLMARGLIRPKEVSRVSKRPERTVYALTPDGHDALRQWMRALLGEPTKEFPQFEAALCLLPVLPPAEALELLRARARKLAEQRAQLQAELASAAMLTLGDVAEPRQELPAPLLGQKFPAVFLVEAEYRLALLKAECEFVDELVRRIVEDRWGPVDLWQEIQANCERQYRRENKIAVDETARAAPA